MDLFNSFKTNLKGALAKLKKPGNPSEEILNRVSRAERRKVVRVAEQPAVDQEIPYGDGPVVAGLRR